MKTDADRRLEQMTVQLDRMTKRLDRVERANRMMKVVGAIAFAAMLPIASVAAKSGPMSFAAQEFDLLGPGGNTTASLKSVNGTPALQFYDANGKQVLSVGYNSTSAGIAAFDGNALFPGSGIVRNTWLEYNVGGGFVGNVTYDPSGQQRTSVGQFLADNSTAGFFVKDGNGDIRNGLIYETTPAFNGVFSEDAKGDVLSLLGDNLSGNSFMNLLDTAGVLRVNEFQDSTNEGGIATSPTNTFDGAWGNP